jgi:transcriptional regulator with XRE-family HTH domain
MDTYYGAAHMAAAIYSNYRDGNIHWMDKLGHRIRALRKSKGLTQVQLAESIGIDQSTLSDIESKDAKFSADILMRLCDELGVSAEMLMRGSDPLLWPFRRIAVERFMVLSDEDRAYIEGKLEAALESLPPIPKPAGASVTTGTVERKKRVA